MFSNTKHILDFYQQIISNTVSFCHRNPLCMSTAIVYMHRFYMINSFKAFNRAVSFPLLLVTQISLVWCCTGTFTIDKMV